MRGKGWVTLMPRFSALIGLDLAFDESASLVKSNKAINALDSLEDIPKIFLIKSYKF